MLARKDATEAALKGLRRPRVLHVATHGFFFADRPRQFPSGGGSPLRGTFDAPDESPSLAEWENPLLRSGLVLAGVRQGRSGPGEDGVLTALEVAGLDLRGTRLVVLSACETGLGEAHPGGGVFGLRRALVLAGSETQVMSLWKVSDNATRDLMVAYYKRLQAGEGRSEAMRAVQLAMLKSVDEGAGVPRRDSLNDRRHPYYWAAFIQSGAWTPLDKSTARPNHDSHQGVRLEPKAAVHRPVPRRLHIPRPHLSFPSRFRQLPEGMKAAQ